MKITIKHNTDILRNVPKGECILVGNEIFMVTRVVEGKYCKVINLGTGDVSQWASDERVVPVEVELVVTPKGD